MVFGKPGIRKTRAGKEHERLRECDHELAEEDRVELDEGARGFEIVGQRKGDERERADEGANGVERGGGQEAGSKAKTVEHERPDEADRRDHREQKDGREPVD